MEGKDGMRKRITTMFGALMVSLGVALMIGSPAAASESNSAVDTAWSYEHSKECYYLDYVSGCIQEAGDILWVKDNRSNGYSVSLTWQDSDSLRSGTCINTIGTAAGWGTCNKDFTEGHVIQWRLGWETSSGWHFSREGYSNPWYETKV
jgi:hypothetical protein